jgi:hypothetical protein
VVGTVNNTSSGILVHTKLKIASAHNRFRPAVGLPPVCLLYVHVGTHVFVVVARSSS